MNILTIMGTKHKGNTRAVVDLFLNEFNDGKNNFDEIVLPDEMPEFCCGCANCILKGEEYCPHYSYVKPVVEKLEKADLIIIGTPVFVMSCTGSLKALLDHLAYMWLVHRPNEKMFGKTALIVTSAGGSGVFATVKLLKNNLFYLGISDIFSFGITTMKMGGNYCDYKHKDKIQKQVKAQADKIKKHLAKHKVTIKSKMFFNIFKMSQKNSWNKTDSDYWKEKGWLSGKKPY